MTDPLTQKTQWCVVRTATFDTYEDALEYAEFCEAASIMEEDIEIVPALKEDNG